MALSGEEDKWYNSSCSKEISKPLHSLMNIKVLKCQYFKNGNVFFFNSNNIILISTIMTSEPNIYCYEQEYLPDLHCNFFTISVYKTCFDGGIHKFI